MAIWMSVIVPLPLRAVRRASKVRASLPREYLHLAVFWINLFLWSWCFCVGRKGAPQLAHSVVTRIFVTWLASSCIIVSISVAIVLACYCDFMKTVEGFGTWPSVLFILSAALRIRSCLSKINLRFRHFNINSFFPCRCTFTILCEMCGIIHK